MNQPADRPWWRSATGLITLAALGAAVLYVAFVHIDHILKVLPLLFILACPLMHIFMHRGHGGHRHGSGPHGRPNDTTAPRADDARPGDRS